MAEAPPIPDAVLQRARAKQAMPVTQLELSHTENFRVLPDRTELLRRLPANGVVAEVGAAFGDYTSEIMAINRPRILHLVDVWSSDRYREGLERIRTRFREELEDGRLVINTGLSTERLPDFPDGTFDWVYIDTNHGYPVTWQELLICDAKVKQDGYIAGHDFCTGNVVTPVPYGVIEAVCRFCVDRGWQFAYLTLESHGHFSFALSRRNAR